MKRFVVILLCALSCLTFPCFLHAQNTPSAQQDDYHDSAPGFLNQALKQLFSEKSGSVVNPTETDIPVQPQSSLEGSLLSITGEGRGLALIDINRDGDPEIALALADSLLILNRQGNVITSMAAPKRVEFLALDVFDLDRNGIPELYLTAISGSRLQSVVMSCEQGGCHLLQSGLPWYFRVYHSANGPVLMGQQRESASVPFAGSPVVLTMGANGLTADYNIPLPAGFNLYNSMSFRDDSKGLIFLGTTGDDHLQLISEKSGIFWTSEDIYGGAVVKVADGSSSEKSAEDPTLIAPRMQLTAAGEILVVQNQGLRLFSRTRVYQHSRLAALRWTGETLEKSWVTQELNGALVDFCYLEKQQTLLLLISEKDSLLAKAPSRIDVIDIMKSRKPSEQ